MDNIKDCPTADQSLPSEACGIIRDMLMKECPEIPCPAFIDDHVANLIILYKRLKAAESKDTKAVVDNGEVVERVARAIVGSDFDSYEDVEIDREVYIQQFYLTHMKSAKAAIAALSESSGKGAI